VGIDFTRLRRTLNTLESTLTKIQGGGASPNTISNLLLVSPAVGIREVQDDFWQVSFMDFDWGYFDLKTRALQPLDNPFGPKLLPM
jgi:hypothetical protein